MTRTWTWKAVQVLEGRPSSILDQDFSILEFCPLIFWKTIFYNSLPSLGKEVLATLNNIA
jgi:hypothetical protein